MAQAENPDLGTDAWRLQLLINSVVDYAIFQLDAKGVVTTWNSGAQRIKGYTADEIIGQHFSRFYAEEDQVAGIPMRNLGIAAEEGKYEAEGWRVRKDGSRFWASVVIDPIRDDAGELVGFAKVTRDVTERMEAQRALREIQEQLSASQRLEAVGQLSGGIAHDFNNLLMIILGNLDTAQRGVQAGKSDASVLRALANATRGAQRAATLTHRLLAFSRRQPLSPRILDLNKYLPGVADFLQRALGERIEIDVAGAPGLWPIEVDVAQLETSLVNLAINARDAMPKGGKITIDVLNQNLDFQYLRANPEVSPGQYVVISVADTGEGMTKEVLTRAFEPFFTTKEIGRGTGLGLSQVYGFVKQSGGNVKIYSEQDLGTTVKMYFPRFGGDGEQSAEQSYESLKGDTDGETILVVEDDKDLRAYIVEALRTLNYRVIHAADADSALEFLKQSSIKIDLMLTDVVMPGMNGRQLSNWALELRPNLKVLFMSGYSRNAVVHRGRIDLDIELIQKPISLQELTYRIREALDRRMAD